MNANHLDVLLPVLLIWAVVIASWAIAVRQDHRTPADDIGMLWLFVLALYVTLPAISWLRQGGRYSIESGYRLMALQPTEIEIADLLEIGLAYAVGFAIVYSLLRRRLRPIAVGATDSTGHGYISSPKMVAAFAIVVIVKLAILVLALSGFIRTPDSYIDSYLSIHQLPLAAQQLIKIGAGIAVVAQMVLLVALLQRWPRHRLMFGIYLATVLLTFDPEGSRTAVVTGLITVAVAWHVLVRPIPLRWWIGGASAGLFLFLAIGFRRNTGSWGEAGMFPADTVGEFDALWANALDLLRARDAGRLDVSFTTRFGELWAFVPSQLLPFQKTALADWFALTFYPEYQARGGGWAFGALSQAVIGGGVLEAVFRGVILGALFAWVQRWYRTTSATWWRLPLYLFLLGSVYQSIRDTTFRQLADVVQMALPGLLLVGLLGRLLSRQKPVVARAGQRT